MLELDLEKQRSQRSNCQHPLDHRKRKSIPEEHLFLFIDYAKAFDYVDHHELWKILQEMGIPGHRACFLEIVKPGFQQPVDNKLWKIIKEMGISDHLTCLLRNLYAGQEATVRTGHGQRRASFKYFLKQQHLLK